MLIGKLQSFGARGSGEKVDRRIAEFAFGLPDDYKAGRGQRKRILRMIAAGRLPKTITARTDRIGFGTPIMKETSLLGLSSPRSTEADTFADISAAVVGESARSTTTGAPDRKGQSMSLP